MRTRLSLLLLALSFGTTLKASSKQDCYSINTIVINSLGGYSNLRDYSNEISAQLNGKYEVILNNSNGSLHDALASLVYDQTTSVSLKAEFIEGQCFDQFSEIKNAIHSIQLNPDLKHNFIENISQSPSHLDRLNSSVYINLYQDFALKNTK